MPEVNKKETGWKRMQFKKNKVWVATDGSKKLIVKNGKVLIKYQLKQDYEYWVHEQSVGPIDTGQSKKSVNKKPAQKRKGKTKPFKEPIPHDTVCIFTDGASSGNPGPSGVGVLLKYGEHEKEISKYIGIATNNIAELEAINTGLLELKKTDMPVRIFTDSSYAYGLLALGWKARANQDLVKAIRETISKFKDLKIIKVKGHAGHAENERADFLATSAIKNKIKK
jgi:ribonuclease HI